MAIITTEKNNFTSTNTSWYSDDHSVVELELKQRQFIFSDIYPYIMAITGDNKSQIITFKTPAQYDGIDLFGTFCVLTYWTSWVDDDGKNSKGYIILTEKDHDDNNIWYEWVLDLNQTARAGICKFTLTFYLPLEDSENEDFYSKYNNYLTNNAGFELTIVNDNNIWKVNNNNQLIEYPYYALSSNSGQFNIIDPGIGEGGPLHLSGEIVTELLREMQTLRNALYIRSFNDLDNSTPSDEEVESDEL